jgi:flagellin
VTTFNGRALLNGTAAPVTFQVGINTTTNDQIAVTFGGATSTALSVSNISVSGTDASNSLASITAIDAAIQNLSTTRENFGAAINRFTTTVTNLQSQHTNLAAALSRIQDVDIASETASLSRNQVLSQAGAAVLAQANQAPQLALSLLRG